jgi:hypothetical protein
MSLFRARLPAIGPRYSLCLAIAVGLLVQLLPACRPSGRPVVASGPEEEPLHAPSREFLAERLMLVDAGRHREAHARWAKRALLAPAGERERLPQTPPTPATPEPPATLPTPETPGAPETREEAWSRQITVAITAFESQSRPGSTREAERLAQSYDRAGWFREANSVLRRAEGAGTLSREGQDLRAVTDNLMRFAAALDSLPTTIPAASIPSTAAAVARRHGFTAEGLRARGLYFGARPAARHPEVTEVELAVMVASTGPAAVKQLESTASVRRIVLDDNVLEKHAPAPIWASASLIEIDAGTVHAYHRRDRLRTAAVDLFRTLEAEGGKVSPAPPSAPDTVLAAELRLRAVLPIFDAARADGSPRHEALRRFAVNYAGSSMAHAEAEGVRRLLDERARPRQGASDAAAARGLLAAMAFAPNPRLALAQAIEVAFRMPGPEGGGARAALAALEASMRTGAGALPGDAGSGGDRPQASDRISWTALDDRQLRALALAALGEPGSPP